MHSSQLQLQLRERNYLRIKITLNCELRFEMRYATRDWKRLDEWIKCETGPESVENLDLPESITCVAVKFSLASLRFFKCEYF